MQKKRNIPRILWMILAVVCLTGLVQCELAGRAMMDRLAVIERRQRIEVIACGLIIYADGRVVPQVEHEYPWYDL